MLLKQWIVNYKVKKIKKNKISYKNYINLIKKKQKKWRWNNLWKIKILNK